MAFVGGMMPIERPEHLRNISKSAYNSPIGSPVVSPAGSRRSSVSSISSARTEPGLDLLVRLRQSSIASDQSRTSKQTNTSTDSVPSNSKLKSLFGRSKKAKETKPQSKIVLTSKHAATVKNKLLQQGQHFQTGRPHVKTAGVIGTQTSGHLTAAAQEARHPHSGPPSKHVVHAVHDLPVLTRIVSGDERDEEDETARNLRMRLEWEISKQSTMSHVTEHEHDESGPPTPDSSMDEDESQGKSPPTKGLYVDGSRRPIPVTRNSHGGRFHKDDKGLWRR